MTRFVKNHKNGQTPPSQLTSAPNANQNFSGNLYIYEDMITRKMLLPHKCHQKS